MSANGYEAQIKGVDARVYSSGGGIDFDKTLGYIGGGLSMLDMTKTGIDIAREYGATSKLLPIASKVLGPAGYLGAGVNTVHDVMALQSGDISTGRFSYRTVGTGIGLGVGISVGAIPGALVGGLSWAGEQMYDGAIFAIDKISQFFGNCASALNSGQWIPGN